MLPPEDTAAPFGTSPKITTLSSRINTSSSASDPRRITADSMKGMSLFSDRASSRIPSSLIIRNKEIPVSRSTSEIRKSSSSSRKGLPSKEIASWLLASSPSDSDRRSASSLARSVSSASGDKMARNPSRFPISTTASFILNRPPL